MGKKKNKDEEDEFGDDGDGNTALKRYSTEKAYDEALQEAPVEEHLILRIPEKVAKHLRPLVAARDVPSEQQLSITWKDARHGKITIYGKKYHCTLVDLPCITESLKTLDNKQFYKIADLSQMIVVSSKPVKDYTWPDGVSPVLKDVRNRRFRKRMNKKIVEDVEQEVERLLSADYEALDITYEVLERKEEEEEEDLEEDDSDIADENEDFDLDAAIDEAMDPDEEDDESDDDEASEDSDEENPDERNEENELKIQANTLRHEIASLEVKLQEKEKLASNQVNAIMRERFNGIVDKLARELTLKREQLETLEELIRDEEQLG